MRRPLGLKAMLAAVLTVPLAIWVIAASRSLSGDRRLAPDMIALAPGAIAYRAPGDFSRAGRPAKPPISTMRIERTLTIMKRQVTATEYQRCVEAGACLPRSG